MGKTAKAYEADDIHVAELQGLSATARAAAVTQGADDRRAAVAAQLGGDAQLYDDPVDARLGAYTSRWEVDQNLIGGANRRAETYKHSSKEQQAWDAAWFEEFSDDADPLSEEGQWLTASKGSDALIFKKGFRGINTGVATARDAGDYYGSIQERANAKFEQAEKAAKSGAWEAAAKLRAEGQKIGEGAYSLKGVEGVLGMGQVNAEAAAASALQSPMARAVGALVRQGAEFQDPDSEVSRRFKKSLTAGASDRVSAGEKKQLRALAGSVQQAERQQRDLALQRGGGRNFAYESGAKSNLADRAAGAQANVHLETATQLAEIEGQADRFFESFSRDFTANSVQAGQAFVDNQAGIRDQFVMQLNNLSMAANQFSAGMADRANDRWQFEAQMAAQSGFGAVTGQLVGSVASAASSFF